MRNHLHSLLKNLHTFLVDLEMEKTVICIPINLNHNKQFYYVGAKSIKFKNELLSSIKADSAYSVDNTFDTLYKLHDKE